MIVLVVVAVLLVLLATGLLVSLAVLSRRESTDLTLLEEVQPPEEPLAEPEVLDLTQIGGQDQSWNDLVFHRLKAHYPGFDGSINDYLARYRDEVNP